MLLRIKFSVATAFLSHHSPPLSMTFEKTHGRQLKTETDPPEAFQTPCFAKTYTRRLSRTM